MTQASAAARGAHLTLAEAADACGVSHSTIRRKQGQFANAYKDNVGTWRVPISDLLGAGLKLRPRSDPPPSDRVTQDHDLAGDLPELVQARAQIAGLIEDLAVERTARQVAETKVMLLTANLDDLRFSLRAITGPPAAPQPPPAAEPVPTPPEPRRAAETPSRRRWPWSSRSR